MTVFLNLQFFLTFTSLNYLYNNIVYVYHNIVYVYRRKNLTLVWFERMVKEILNYKKNYAYMNRI